MAEGDPSTGKIEVDDAAAYFGVTESSDILHAMMAMSRQDATVKFFDFLSDIVLQPGDFDFEAASERMACEGGEIYYLVAGHLGLMSLPDPLLDALGQPNSSGESMGPGLDSLTDDQRTAIGALADPMRMMKLFAVAHQTGGANEVLTYLENLDRFMGDVGSSAEALHAINSELTAALDVAGHVLPHRHAGQRGCVRHHDRGHGHRPSTTSSGGPTCSGSTHAPRRSFNPNNSPGRSNRPTARSGSTEQ